MTNPHFVNPLKYDGTDGIWGPFKLEISAKTMDRIAATIATQVLPKPPLQSLLRSLVESWFKAQGVMPTFFNLLQFFKGRYYMERHLDSDVVRSLCQDPLLLKALQSFLGDRFWLWRSEILVSKPGRKIIPFWHQDRYAKFLRGPGKGMTAYIALTEVNETNGMEYMPLAYVESGDVQVAKREAEVVRIAGNHHFVVPARLECQAIAVDLQPGEFVLFDERLVHRSINNCGLQDRVAMAVRFVEENVEVLSGFSAIQAEPILLEVN